MTDEHGSAGGSGPELTIYISYRRSDTSAHAGRLYDALRRRFGGDQLVMDVDALSPGENWATTLEAAARTDVVLAVIGDDWATAVDPSGKRRIDSDTDRIRLEIEAALEQGKQVIPVLFDDARMPLATEIPESLHPLLERDAIRLSHDTFQEDIEQLDRVLRTIQTSRRQGFRGAEIGPGMSPQGRPVTTAPAEAPDQPPITPPLSPYDVEDLDVPAFLRRERESVSPSPSEAVEPEESAPYLDENAQFTVYRPTVIQPQRWYTMLAFAHLASRRGDSIEEPDPVEEMRRQAALILGDAAEDYVDLTADSSAGIPREGELTFIPNVDGIEFNPPARHFRWRESVHREEFRLRAAPSLTSGTARGRLSIFLGAVLLADVNLVLRIQSVADPVAPDYPAAHARRYRAIFASYSHLDIGIVRQCQAYARTLGDRLLLDELDLRSGEQWNPALLGLIRQADVFQLFWSSNSMRSKYVKQEWEYALALGRPNFVRPVYWEARLPRDPAAGLPPPHLMQIHFERLRLAPTPEDRLAADPYASPAVRQPTSVAGDDRSLPYGRIEGISAPATQTQAPSTGLRAVPAPVLQPQGLRASRAAPRARGRAGLLIALAVTLILLLMLSFSLALLPSVPAPS